MSMFRKKSADDNKDQVGLRSHKNYEVGATLTAQAFSELLRNEPYSRLVKKLEQLSPELTTEQSEACYGDFISHFFDYCQALPRFGHLELAGLFHHGLLRGYGMCLAIDEYYRQAEHSDSYWKALARYIGFTAGALLDIHQVCSHNKIVFCDASNGQAKAAWNPLQGGIYKQAQGCRYKIYKISSNLANLYRQLNLQLAQACMPVTGMAWIASDHRMHGDWIKLLTGEQGLWGPFAYALQHYQRFLTEFALPFDWAEQELFAGMELGEAFFQWLQSLSEEDLARLRGSIQDTSLGAALDIETLAKEFSQTPQGRVVAETHGGTIALHAAVLSQFRDLFPFGVDAMIKTSKRGGISFTGKSGVAVRVIASDMLPPIAPLASGKQITVAAHDVGKAQSQLPVVTEKRTKTTASTISPNTSKK